MVENRTIDITSRYLSEVDRSGEVAQWATDNIDRFNSYLIEYDYLIASFNELHDERLLEAMPKAKSLKESLNGVPLPRLDEMAEGNFARALIKSKNLILKGQQINKGEIEATQEEKLIAIGTPSYNTSLEALAVGTAAHLAERTFFEWAKRNNSILEEDWKKDDWLHGLKDVLILLEARKLGNLKLTQLFLKRSNLDGLSWMNNQEFNEAVEKLRKILNS